MDKRFEDIINKMETQSEEARKLQEHVTSLFKKVEETQKQTEGKIEKINAELEKAISKISKTLESIQSDYQSKVDDLIKSINNKSDEILTIHNELNNIKKIEKDAVETFGKIADDQKNLLNKSDVKKIVENVKQFDSRINHLEEHAHKHTIGGTKV